jgi:hypothetical protein
LEIRAIEVTDNATGDAPMLPCLLDQIPADEIVSSVSGDGAYDTKGCHEAIAQLGAQAIIPTRKNAKPWKDHRPGAIARNAILAATRLLGRKIWKKWSGYHRRSLVETKMRCFKLLGERVWRVTLTARSPNCRSVLPFSIGSPSWAHLKLSW